MIHTAHGYWLAEAGAVEPAPALEGEERADVVIIGGGYTGLWTAWQLRERGASVVVLESGLCGHGPSGRNGGFCETLWTQLPSLEERFGRGAGAEAVPRVGGERDAIGRWCSEQGVDAWFTPGGYVMASTAPAHDADPRRDRRRVAARPRAGAQRGGGARALRLAALPPRAAGGATTRPSSRRGSRSGCATGCGT